MKTKIFGGFRKEPRAQSLVELAISLMIMLLLLLGAVEFSLALFQYVTIRDAAQEGAIYGSINPTKVEGIKYRVEAAAEHPDDPDNLYNSGVVSLDRNGTNPKLGTVTVTINGDDCEGTSIISGVSTPNSLTITVRYPHPIIFPLIAPNPITLTARVTNTILQPTCTP